MEVTGGWVAALAWPLHRWPHPHPCRSGQCPALPPSQQDQSPNTVSGMLTVHQNNLDILIWKINFNLLPSLSSNLTYDILSQSPNNSSPSSGPSALLAGLTNHLQQDRQQNFAAAAATQNGECTAPNTSYFISLCCRPS